MATTPESFIEKLKTALDLVEALKKDNDLYKQNFDQLSLNFTNLQDKHERLSKEFVVVSKENESLLTDVEESKEKFKQKVSEKDFEIQKLKIAPPTQKQVEIMRLQIKEDTEKSFDDKFKFMEQECNKFRSLYYKVKREWENSRSEYDLKFMEFDREKKELLQEHELKVSNLQNKIGLLQTQTEDTSELVRLRTTQREKVELELRVKSLVSELEEIRLEVLIRTEKEELRLQSEKEERNHKRQLADHISASKGFHSEKDSLQSRCNVLEDELRIVNRRKDELMEESARTKKELEKTISMMEDNCHKFKSLIFNQCRNQ